MVHEIMGDIFSPFRIFPIYASPGVLPLEFFHVHVSLTEETVSSLCNSITETF